MSNKLESFKNEFGQIKDSEVAEVGAYAEKPVRDIAYVGNLTEDQKKSFSDVANIKGEEAMEKYLNEKEESKDRVIFSGLDKAIKKVKEGASKSDAEIAEKINGRLNSLISYLKSKKQELEKRYEKELPSDALRQIIGQGNDQIPVYFKVGENGGGLYAVNAGIHMWGKNENEIKKGKEEFAPQSELINYSLSNEGKEIFLSTLGVLKPGQKAIDLPVIYERMLNVDYELRASDSKYNKNHYQINPLNYDAHFPTNIPNVTVQIVRGYRQYDNTEKLPTDEMYLNFGPEFMGNVFEGKI